MSTTNKNKNSISETLLEMDELTKAIKKESKETISQLLSEAVKGYLNEAICEDEDEYEIEDETEEMTDETPEMGAEDATDEMSDVDTDEWSEFEDFKVGEDTYDFTGEEDDNNVVKVYKLLNDDDQIVIKDENGEITLKDNETGAEYVIKTGCKEESTPEIEDVENEMPEETPDFDTNPESDEDEEFEIEFDGEDDVMDNDTDFEEDNNDEEDETMKEGKEMVFEIDLGYTDNYQDKDPIKGLSNNEPSKSGKSWHKGVPQDTKKPWAGKVDGKAKPFEKKVACCEGEDLNLDAPVDEMTNDMENVIPEGTNVTLPNRRKKVKSHSMQQKDYPKVAHQDSKNADYKALEETCKRLQKENKELKAIIPQIKKAMNESVLVNYKLGRIVKLFSENTTTRKEKVDIINRFNEEAKTINETKALYESVKRELNLDVKKTPMLENNISTANKTLVNETTVYQSNDVREMINLINRIERN